MESKSLWWFFMFLEVCEETRSDTCWSNETKEKKNSVFSRSFRQIILVHWTVPKKEGKTHEAAKTHQNNFIFDLAWTTKTCYSLFNSLFCVCKNLTYLTVLLEEECESTNLQNFCVVQLIKFFVSVSSALCFSCSFSKLMVPKCLVAENRRRRIEIQRFIFFLSRKTFRSM